MKYDYKKLYEENAEILTARKNRKKAVLIANDFLFYFFLAAYAVLWAYGFFSDAFSPVDFLKLFFLPVSTVFVCFLVRLGADRPRPYAENGANVSPLRKKKYDSASFPCIPVALATTLSMLFSPYLLPVGILCGAFTLALAYCRFSVGWHYPSDILAGIAFGGVVGSLVFFL